MSGDEAQMCSSQCGANTLSCCSCVQMCCGPPMSSQDIQGLAHLRGSDGLLHRDDSQLACSRKCWVKELLQKNVEVVHLGNCSHWISNDVLRESKARGTHNSCGGPEMFTTNQRGPTVQDRHASIVACVIQQSCCAGEMTLRARSTAAIARDMIGNNNHDCGGPDTSDELLDSTHVLFPLNKGRWALMS